MPTQKFTRRYARRCDVGLMPLMVWACVGAFFLGDSPEAWASITQDQAAQPVTNETRPTSQPPPAAEPAEPASPIQVKPGQAQPTEQSDNENKGGVGCGGAVPKGAGPTPSPDGPQPKYVCNEPKCAIPPVWRGEDAVFTFTIGNEGEGDLQIRLKGG